MRKFKVGDRVRLKEPGIFSGIAYNKVMCGTVRHISVKIYGARRGPLVEWDELADDGRQWWIDEEYIELEKETAAQDPLEALRASSEKLYVVEGDSDQSAVMTFAKAEKRALERANTTRGKAIYKLVARAFQEITNKVEAVS